MSFLYPTFLYALLFLLIPIIIHFFNLQRTKKVYFTNIAFLEKVKEQSSTKLKFKQWLILLSRLLFMTFLIVAFAQPFIPSEDNKLLQKDRILSIYLDNSLSMKAKEDNETLLNRGLHYINGLLGINQGQNVNFFTNDFKVNNQYFFRTDLVEEQLTEVAYSPFAKKINTVLARQQQNYKKLEQNALLETYVISDFQKSTVGNLEEAVQKLDTNQQVYFLPINSQQSANLFVDSLWLSSSFIRLQENNELWVKLVNSGDTDIENASVQLIIDGKHKNSLLVSIPANSTKQDKISFSVDQSGLKNCKIILDDSPVDFDNEYYFVLNVNNKIQVLILEEEEENKAINTVFTNEAVFDPQIVSINNLDYEAFDKADIVVLSHLKNWNSSLEQVLRSVLERGGSICVVPNKEMDVSFLNTWLAGYNLPSLASSSDTSATELGLLPYKNPFFQNVFDEEVKQIKMPLVQNSLNIPKTSYSLLQNNRGYSFFNEHLLENGKIYLFSSPLSEDYTNFTKHALFVPIMYKMAMRSTSVNTQLAYHTSQNNLNLNGNFFKGSTTYKLKNQEGKEYISNQKVINQSLSLELPEDIGVGFFEVVAQDSVVSKVALNYSKRESMMECYSPEELQNVANEWKNVHVLDLKSAVAHNNFTKNQAEGLPLWKYCLILGLLFLLLEILLIRLL